MSDIHPKGIHGGDQYGTTIMNSKSHINVPKKQSVPPYGKQLRAAKPMGGTQYGTTIQDSKPYRAFPNADVPLRSGSVPQKGSAMKVDSEKVISSATSAGRNVKTLLTGDGTSSSGGQPAVRFGKKGQMGDSTAKVF